MPHRGLLAPVAHMGRKALIKVGYSCNENCTFCHTLEHRHVDGSTDEVGARIERAAELGHDMVVLSGGEPTMRPELLDWASQVCRLGMDFGLVTNGLVLAYPELVEKLLARRLRYVYQSVHGGTAEIHNRVVRADTFEAAWKAVENLSGRGLDYTLHCVVTRQNVDHLDAFVDRALAFPDVVVKFSMVFPKGGGDAFFDVVTPRVSEAAVRVREAILHGQRRVAASGAEGPAFAHDGFPLCLLPGLEDLFNDLKTNGYATMVEIGEPDFFPVDDVLKVQPEEVCGPCALRGPCPGLYRGYHDTFGSAEIAPVLDRPRPNSYNYTFEELVTSSAADDLCPLRDGPLGVTPWDRGRELFVRHGPRIGRYRTATRDFSDVEIEVAKHDRGQVYLDASRKDAPDDFARDLVPLRRSRLCDPCAERERCTGLFEPVLSGNLFERDDAWVRSIVSELAGDVLDIGPGHGPYGDVLEALSRSGRIRYVGVEPDEKSVAALRERWPWATLIRGEGEKLDTQLPQDRLFDHALLLRSWNHLRRPPAVLAGLMRRLRSGGTVTLVDNVVFGLARTVAQTRRAERSAAGFEHYRNDTAEEATRAAAGLGWTLIERRDVEPEGSNQWLLRYRVAC